MAFAPPGAPPSDEAELFTRAKRLAGWPLASIAAGLGRPVPPSLERAKGWVGQVLEEALGATASTRPEPDFVTLGVELKTIPVDRFGQPRESTFVCTAPLLRVGRTPWPASPVAAKLRRVLWIPVEAEPSLTIAERRVGHPLLWSPSEAEEAVLRDDWEELAELIERGFVESVTAHRGQVLQVRPKAADAKARTWAADAEGDPMRTLPRGFYLRRRFTAELLARSFRLPGGG